MRALGLAGYRWALPRISSVSLYLVVSYTFETMFIFEGKSDF